MSKPRSPFRQSLLVLSALSVAVLMAASPAEARRLKLGGFKSSPSAPAPAASKSIPGKGGNTLIVIPGAGAGATASKATAQETSPTQQRQIMPTRIESPPVVKADTGPRSDISGPRSEIPVLGATASARPAPTSFATLN